MDIDEAVRLLRFWATYDKFPQRVEAVEVLLQAYERDREEVARLREALTEMTEWAKKNREWFLGSNQLRAKFEQEAILLRLALEGDAEARAALAPQAEAGQEATP